MFESRRQKAESRRQENTNQQYKFVCWRRSRRIDEEQNADYLFFFSCWYSGEKAEQADKEKRASITNKTNRAKPWL